VSVRSLYVIGMSGSHEKKIIVSKDGPYLISGDIPLTVQIISTNREGQSWEWKEGRSFDVKSNYRLCRCGKSKDSPFCDDSHLRVPFDGEETATRASFQEQAGRYDGPTLTLSDAENFCAFARFCDPGGKIWGLMGQTDKPRERELVIREAMHCPSGRLVLHDNKTRKEIEPELTPSIGVVEDPALKCSGPLWVRGGIMIVSQDGTPYERRNRVTLCRCGASGNKPFCDGSHASIKFRDGLLK
jgi:CDGSH-type Zn-finger protein